MYLEPQGLGSSLWYMRYAFVLWATIRPLSDHPTFLIAGSGNDSAGWQGPERSAAQTPGAMGAVSEFVWGSHGLSYRVSVKTEMGYLSLIRLGVSLIFLGLPDVSVLFFGSYLTGLRDARKKSEDFR